MKENIIQILNQGWEYQKVGDGTWNEASVPGSIHIDLLNQGKISDPFFGTNELDLQWIMENDWTYRLIFNPNKKIQNKKNKLLRFHGIDTYADIFLNDKKIISAKNMFHPWYADVSDILRNGSNELIVYFRSPIKEILPSMKKFDYELPADNDQAGKTSPYTRKAPYHYGWDWGPCFVTTGLWKNVDLLAWNDWYLDGVSLVNTSCSTKVADVTLECEIIAEKELDANLIIMGHQSETKIEMKISLEIGRNFVSKRFQIKDPELWWPVGHGKQPLYNFDISFCTESQIERVTKKIGLRNLEIIREDSEEGKSFEIHVNNTPIFAKGANWIPADSFVTRLKDEDYRSLLESAVGANMNTLRIWGGGIYEPDIFYELCDELGILIWQDFMFACSMYPADVDFLESVEREARFQINRLKGHPCIALWCGNNEIASGWLSWGWKEELPNNVWGDYKKLFHELLPKVCKEVDPSRLYWPSSPGHSMDLPESDQIYGSGDNHYWGVWHGGDGLEAFEENVGRFMSEYGMQSFPEFKTIRSFAKNEDLHLESNVMLSRQKASLGTGNLIQYIEKYFSLPKNFQSIAGLSQIMQAQSIKKAVETHRKNMPFCMGTLYWQLNDCWPAISWSSLDYFGNWKALHYEAKRFFNPIFLTISEKGNNIEVFIINDQDKSIKATLKLILYDFENNLIKKKSLNLTIQPLSSEPVMFLDKKIFLEDLSDSEVFLHAFVECGLSKISKNNYYFLDQKYLKITKPKFDYNIDTSNNRISIRVYAHSFIQQLHFISLNGQGFFSDNYVDICKGDEIVIFFDQNNDCNSEPKDLMFEIRTLYDLTEGSEPIKASVRGQ